MALPPYQSVHGFEATLKELAEEPALRHAGNYHVVLQYQPHEGASKRYAVSLWRTHPLEYLTRAHARSLARARQWAAEYLSMAGALPKRGMPH